MVVWFLSLVGIIFAPFWAQIVLCVINGNAISTMFNMGHNALHGTLFPHAWMNRIAGRIAMAPSFHPVTSWNYSHNVLHHCYTNIKERDAGFAPLCPADYSLLTPVEKFSYRVSRSWYGCSWLYLKEMWFKWQFFPCPQRAPRDSKSFFFDRLVLVLFLSVWLGLLTLSSASRGVNLFNILSTGFFLPQVISYHFIGFITLQQHTHPKVAWYSELDLKVPTFFESQMHSSPHLVFPRFFRFLMRSTMDHTAHHVDPSLPFYSLSNAQNALEDSFDNFILRERWTFFRFFQNTRICKLYDYTRHQWVGYHGEPLAEPITLLP
jgi:omega-6 fatty acid desaturase (delta-12 desaturase)